MRTTITACLLSALLPPEWPGFRFIHYGYFSHLKANGKITAVCRKGSPETLQYILALAAAAVPDLAPDEGRLRPLHLAVRGWSLEKVKYLRAAATETEGEIADAHAGRSLNIDIHPRGRDPHATERRRHVRPPATR